MKIGERLKGIAEKERWGEYVYYEDVTFLLHHLNELRRMLKLWQNRDAWHQKTCVCEVCDDMRRYMEELEGK